MLRMDLPRQPPYCHAGVLGHFVAYVVGAYQPADDGASRAWRIIPWLPQAGDATTEEDRADRLAIATAGVLLSALQAAGPLYAEDAEGLAYALANKGRVLPRYYGWSNIHYGSHTIGGVGHTLDKIHLARRYYHGPLGLMVGDVLKAAQDLNESRRTHMRPSHEPRVLWARACGHAGDAFCAYYKIVGDPAWDAASTALRHAVG